MKILVIIGMIGFSIIHILPVLQSESETLKEQVKLLSEDNNALKQALNAAEAAVQKHKNKYEDGQVRYKIAEYIRS